uniref:Uncharacterized protein n=1 Tax=Anopheles christyi TaxID=43041 RepID=A0A182KBA1_9DIPT
MVCQYVHGDIQENSVYISAKKLSRTIDAFSYPLNSKFMYIYRGNINNLEEMNIRIAPQDIQCNCYLRQQ